MALNLVGGRLLLRALLLSCGLLTGPGASAQDMSVPADPVAAIEGEWNGIWEEWSVTVTNGRVVLTKGDPKTYNWLPVGTVLGVLTNNGKSEPRAFRFSGSTCLDHQRDQSPSEYKTIPCGDYGAVLSVFADSYELKVSGISLRRPKNAVAKGKSPPKDAGSKPKPLVEKAVEADEPVQEKGPSAAERQRAHEAVEQRNREAQAKYEAEVAEQKRKVEEFERAEEEVARKKAEQQSAAQQLLAQHDAKMAAHDQILQQHDATQRRYNACLAGDQTACADIATGRPATTEFAETDKRQASIDTDANRCVTSPELRLDDTSKGNTAAYVTNGCGKPVDIRICLKEAAGWNCGVGWGIQPQGRWSYSSFHATGQVFVDARTSGSSKPLASPN